MQKAVLNVAQDQDVCILVAVVADYAPKVKSNHKIKKTSSDMVLEFTRTPDILSSLRDHVKEDTFLCGFSMETQDLLENSKKKLISKNVDMIVANNLKEQGAGFGTDTNRVTIISEKEEKNLELMSKEEVADEILNYILEMK